LIVNNLSLSLSLPRCSLRGLERLTVLAANLVQELWVGFAGSAAQMGKRERPACGSVHAERPIHTSASIQQQPDAIQHCGRRVWVYLLVAAELARRGIIFRQRIDPLCKVDTASRRAGMLTQKAAAKHGDSSAFVDG